MSSHLRNSARPCKRNRKDGRSGACEGRHRRREFWEETAPRLLVSRNGLCDIAFPQDGTVDFVFFEKADIDKSLWFASFEDALEFGKSG